MHDRRKFLKRFLIGGAVLGLGPGAGAKAPLKPSREVPKGFSWQRTIFCQIGDTQLLSDIGLVAQKLGCDIWLGEPLSPDIFAIPYFIAIVDRSTLHRDQWAEYLEYCKEAEDTTPFILVDNLGAREDWHIDNHMEILDPKNRAHVRSILERIRSAHSAAQDWKPEYLL